MRVACITQMVTRRRQMAARALALLALLQAHGAEAQGCSTHHDCPAQYYCDVHSNWCAAAGGQRLIARPLASSRSRSARLAANALSTALPAAGRAATSMPPPATRSR
jgi:hypothetical protein